MAQAIADRNQRNKALKSAQNPTAKFESRARVDEERRRAREGMRKLRTSKPDAKKTNAAKHRQRKPNKRPGSAAKPSEPQKPGTFSKRCSQKSIAAKPSNAAKLTQRHIPVKCCGRRKQDCKCFTTGRGLEIVSSLKRKQIDSIAARVRNSRIQTWRDTGDMPGYMRQIGWKASMRYSWLFPIAFICRHFSNEECWKACQRLGAVKVHEQPNFSIMEKVMRAFARAGVS